MRARNHLFNLAFASATAASALTKPAPKKYSSGELKLAGLTVLNNLVSVSLSFNSTFSYKYCNNYIAEKRKKFGKCSLSNVF
ncbi:MAG: hypothetical protein QNJ70_28925 [Xenococcaceae cyanobacterium MO_207.B15]|nr:hypothetical protein [Xenococcaceae cyanobacterium MO_207.B15]